jgi:triosephosphate isomerase (TIM)
MAVHIRPLVAGNWKMNGTSASLDELLAIGRGFTGGLESEVEALVCLPATLLSRAHEVLSRTPVKSGGQDCHWKESGAHTGDVSAEMLKDAGASHVIVGHSERRTDHGETDAIVLAKAEAAWRAGLTAIVCIGETREQREVGATLEILSRQIAGSIPKAATHDTVVVAYEPVWAIGTGKTATPEIAQDAHVLIKDLHDTRVLYGGSVKPENAADLLGQPAVDGALVGGASLEVESFSAICRAAAT